MTDWTPDPQPRYSGAEYDDKTLQHLPPPPPGRPQRRPAMGRILTLAITAAVAVALLVGLALIALFVPPVRLVDRIGGGALATLDEGNPTASHPDGITLRVKPGQTLRVALTSTPREWFIAGHADAEWPGARAAIPPTLTLKSPLYGLEHRGEAEAEIEVAIPNDAEPWRTLGLYTWDSRSGTWRFVPGQVDDAAGAIRSTALPDNVAVFQTAAVTPLIGSVLEPGEALDSVDTSPLNVVFLGGFEAQADGAILVQLGQMPAVEPGTAVLPLVREANATALTTLLNNPANLTLHVSDLRALAVENGYHGVALDYRPLAQEDRARFTELATDLAAALHEVGLNLAVVLPAPEALPPAASAYDYAAVGQAADLIALDFGADPAAYDAGGTAERALAWATGEIDRYKLIAAFPSASYDATEQATLSYEDAIAALGNVALEDGAADAAYEPGDELSFNLDLLETIEYDEATDAYHFTSGQENAHDIWIVTANTVRTRLDLTTGYNLRGVLVLGLGAPGRDDALVKALTEFKVQAASTVPGELVMAWKVQDSSGAVLEEATGLGTPWAWGADEPGEYTVGGEVVGSRAIDRGSVQVAFVDPDASRTATPAPRATATPRANVTPRASVTPRATATPGTPTATLTPRATATAVLNLPAPVAPGGSDGGGFALGGQVPGYVSHPGEMRQASMTWAKYQIKWSPGTDPGVAAGMIGDAHANGFKVLLSITGPLYPSSIDYDGYVNFLRSVAGYGPDAIEVWNEMNLNREWPEGQIDPALYVSRMLAPGFNAIKSASPGTLVIIGALAPTGFDNGTTAWSDVRYVQGLAAAGASRYANCIGVHHNSGTTAPSVRSGRSEGDHYSWYFLPTMEVYYNGMNRALPVCLTEFGYLSPEGFPALPENFAWGASNDNAKQAAWLAEGAQLARSSGYVRMMIVFNVGFTTWTSDDPQAGYSIVRPDGSCPACATLGGG